MAKGGIKMTGGSCSAAAHGQQVYGGPGEQHAASTGGNVIAMNEVKGGKKRSKKSAKKSKKSKTAKKSRRNRSSRRR